MNHVIETILVFKSYFMLAALVSLILSFMTRYGFFWSSLTLAFVALAIAYTYAPVWVLIIPFASWTLLIWTSNDLKIR